MPYFNKGKRGSWSRRFIEKSPFNINLPTKEDIIAKASGVVGPIKDRLAERAGKTETKTRKFLGRTWTKTKKYDDKGKKIGKIVEVSDKGGKKIKHRQKGDISTDAPVTTESKTTTKPRKNISGPDHPLGAGVDLSTKNQIAGESYYEWQKRIGTPKKEPEFHNTPEYKKEVARARAAKFKQNYKPVETDSEGNIV